jgi:tetratricopeptide (TPR) repeat protein
MVRLQATILLAALGLSLAGAVVPAEAERRRADRKREAAVAAAHEQYAVGYTFFRQGLLEKAKDSLEQALRHQSDYPEALYVLGMVHLELDEPKQALSLFRRCLEANPYFTEAHNLLGLAHAKLGDHEAALREFEAVKADVNFPTPEVAHFNIGKLFAEADDCAEALVHLRRATELNAAFGRAWLLLGDCRERLGRLALARDAFDRAAELMPDDPSVRYRLGYACLLTKDVACARREFEYVRTDHPASPLAEGARDFLERLDAR